MSLDILKYVFDFKVKITIQKHIKILRNCFLREV